MPILFSYSQSLLLIAGNFLSLIARTFDYNRRPNSSRPRTCAGFSFLLPNTSPEV